MFQAMEARYENLPDEGRVFGTHTPNIVGALILDCSPVGNFSIQGTTRLLRITGQREPFVMYEQPFSLVREQGEAPDVFNITTSSGQGCIEIMPARSAEGQWSPGTYRIDMLHRDGTVLAAIDFEVAPEKTKRSNAFFRSCDDWPDGTATEIMEFFENATSRAIEACLNSGADPNKYYEGQHPAIPEGARPLHLAAALNDDPSVIATLVAGGAHLEERTYDCYTPLHVAALNKGNPQMATALVNAGANPNVGDHSPSFRGSESDTHCSSGELVVPDTPLHFVVQYGDNPIAIPALVEAGANPNALEP